MYKVAGQRIQKHRERGPIPAPIGSAEWMRRQQAKQQRIRETAAQRDLRQRLDDEVNQAQRAINREGPPSTDARTVNLPLPAGLRRSPQKRSPAAK